ncbi:MAG: ABC transporter permease [Syntrophomonadaceae bacterium]|jgi:hypothetical protein|nr:ABC transporter permease [Syntrophomonadaceae bacterium]
MKNLIRADFFRLFKDKIFYLLIGIAALLPIAANALFYFGYDIMVAQSPDAEALEKALKFVKAFPLSLFAFEISNSAGLLAVIATALHVGREYMNGTIRNKIIAGHSRTAVYGSAFVVSATSALIIVTAFIVSMLALGIPLQGWGAEETLAVCLRQYAAGFLITLAAAAAANMSAILSRGIIASLLINLGVVFGLTGTVSIITMLWDSISMPTVAGFFMKTLYAGQLAFIYDDFTAGFFLTTLSSTAVVVAGINTIGNIVFNRLDLN